MNRVSMDKLNRIVNVAKEAWLKIKETIKNIYDQMLVVIAASKGNKDMQKLMFIKRRTKRNRIKKKINKKLHMLAKDICIRHWAQLEY